MTLNAQQVKDEVAQVLTKAYEAKEIQVTPDIMRGMERMILLHVIDTKWKEHLHTMDQVKDGISLRALGQRDPLVEYKKEGFIFGVGAKMFTIAGPVLVYGISSSVIVGIIYYFIK